MQKCRVLWFAKMTLIQGQDRGELMNTKNCSKKIYKQSYSGLKEVCIDILKD